MDVLATVILLVIALVEIQGKKLDPGPQDLKDSVKLTPLSSQKRYATKEIILYLTPSQIKALQAGQDLISPQYNHHLDNNKQVQPHVQPLPANQDNNEHLHRHLAHPQPLKVPAVEEPHSEPFNPITPPPEYLLSNNHAYINLQPQHQPHISKSIPFFPEPHDQAILRGHELSTLNAHEHLQKSQENNFLRDHLKEQWYRLLDQNRGHLKALAALSKYQIEKSNENKKDLLQYAPKFSEQKYASGIDQLIGNNRQHQLEKQQALLQAEAIANAPPVLVHKEISIKHSPVHLIKQVKVPVPTPVLIPVPEPFEVKVPQPYPVPIEVPVPVPSVPLEVEKHIPVPVTKNVYINVDRPYFVDPREIPVHKSRLVPIHNHGFQH